MPEKSKVKEIKRLCPECDTEVTLVIDDDTGDREGRCPSCKLDVGAIVNRRRYSVANAKLDEEEIEDKKKSKKSSWL